MTGERDSFGERRAAVEGTRRTAAAVEVVVCVALLAWVWWMTVPVPPETFPCSTLAIDGIHVIDNGAEVTCGRYGNGDVWVRSEWPAK